MNVIFLLARALLTATFIISAIRHLTHWTSALDEMVRDGVPRSSLMMAGSVSLRLVGGLMVLLGLYARVGGGLLLMFIVPATFIGHRFWAMSGEKREHEKIELLNNLCMVGGVALIALFGSGPMSLIP
jgi:putative oxidoreductase